MTFHPFSIRFDPWQTDHGAEVAGLDATVDDEDVDLTVEQRGPWSAVVPPPESEAGIPATVFFVDGVRRVDACIVGRRSSDRLFHGAFGSFAVGAVEAQPRERVVRFSRSELERVVATGAGEILPEPVRVNPALTYRPVSTNDMRPIAPERAVHDEMRRAEERLARELAEREVLVITDGPLTFQEATRGLAVGWVKRIEELYIPATHLPALLAQHAEVAKCTPARRCSSTSARRGRASRSCGSMQWRAGRRRSRGCRIVGRARWRWCGARSTSWRRVARSSPPPGGSR